MIGHLRGLLLESSPEGIVVEVQGVGYAVNVPLSTFYELEKSGLGSEVKLHIHTHAREDVLALYGFWSEREKQLFEKLIAVNGIGPRLAQVILSGMAPDDLLAALANGDTARLTTIPGVGKKTAERMVLELRERVQGLAADLPVRPTPAADDLVLALVNLGYKLAHAERAVADTRSEMPNAAFHELLRSSLKRLSRA